jgi:hypothetical protein
MLWYSDRFFFDIKRHYTACLNRFILFEVNIKSAVAPYPPLSVGVHFVDWRHSKVSQCEGQLPLFLKKHGWYLGATPPVKGSKGSKPPFSLFSPLPNLLIIPGD